MAGLLPSTLLCNSSNSAIPYLPPSFSKRPLVRCLAKKKISFVDQILDYIEGGPKLRKWYGAPDIVQKDESAVEEDEYPEELDEIRDAILVTDGDTEIAQMIILSLIVKRLRIKAIVKDKKKAMESFGSYVESMAGDTSNKLFIKKALRGVATIISPNEGFMSRLGSFKGIQHIILLSQAGRQRAWFYKLSVYRGSSGIEALMKENAKKLGEQDESIVKQSGIPYTIIRAGMLDNTPGGTQGFSFQNGSAANGSLSKEDAASICVESLSVVPPKGFLLEVVNGGEKVSDWKQLLTRLIEKEGDLTDL